MSERETRYEYEIWLWPRGDLRMTRWQGEARTLNEAKAEVREYHGPFRTHLWSKHPLTRTAPTEASNR